MSPLESLFIPPGSDLLGYEEYVELPNDGKTYQIIEGELYVNPAPIPRHQYVSKRLQYILMRELELTGRGQVYDAPIDVILDPHTIVQPDLLFIAADRTSIVGPKAIVGAPDLVVEILSPSTRRTDVLVKSRVYARLGVLSYWIADPAIDRLEFFRAKDGKFRLIQTINKPDVAEPEEFPGLRLPTDEIF